MIHSYDDPDHAPLGERAAERYAKVAPDAGHAQHMVSHIYLSLGRWDQVERANLTAVAVVDGQRKAAGDAEASCGHYNEWLAYALDQQSEDSRGLIDTCRAQATAALASNGDRSWLGDVRNQFNSWAIIAVRHGVDTGRWPDWSAIPPGDGALIGRFDLAYGKLLSARRHPANALAALAELKRLKARIDVVMASERPDDHETDDWLGRAIAQGEAVVALAHGKTEQGLGLLRAAAEAEAALPLPFGPPVLAKPGFEMLGDEYLALGRKSDAAAAYRRSLEDFPGRRLSVEGLARAAA
jgi:tetratricopeptide (TPR) repeat protein